MKNWIWTIPPKSANMPFPRYDDEESVIPSYDVMSIRRLVQNKSDNIVLRLDNTPISRIHELSYLPSYDRTPILNSTLMGIISHFSGNDVQFLPIILRAKDGIVTKYVYARPLVGVPCVDIEKSEITHWIIPNEKIMDAKHLTFKPDCLEKKHFVRDTFTSHIVVSGELKDALMQTGARGLNFCLPKDVWNIYKE